MTTDQETIHRFANMRIRLRYSVFKGAEMIAAFPAQDEAVTYAKDVESRMVYEPFEPHLSISVFRDACCVFNA